MPRPLWLAALLLAAVGVVGAVFLLRGAGDDRPELRVAAAADLRGAFEEVAAAFEARCECRVTLTFGSSGNLSAQIREGLPVDVFASANADFVDRLARDDLILPDTRQLYAIGAIVLAVPMGSTLDLTDLAVLADPAVRRVSIANPAHAPYGMAAREALESAGIWEAVQPKLVLGENAAIATEYVQTANVDAGIIPLSLAIQRRGAFRYEPIDQRLHEPLEQVMAAIRRSRNPVLASDFVAYVNGPEGREIMRRYGFVLPGEAVSR
jgi:molybdate transport system substrate-binding protein